MRQEGRCRLGGGVGKWLVSLNSLFFFFSEKIARKREKIVKTDFFITEKKKKITDYYDKYLKLGRRKEILDVLPSQLTLRVRNKTHGEEALDNK